MSVSFHRAGSGSPVVMVHGLGSRWELFKPIIDAVAAEHDVIAVDLPGFGRTPADPRIDPSPRAYAEWLKGWFAEQGISNPHVVGSSMGGGIALELGRMGVASRVTAFSPIGFYGTAGRLWTQGLLTTIRGVAGALDAPVAKALDYRAGRAALLAPFFGHPTKVSPDAGRLDVAGLIGASAFPKARNSFGNFMFQAGDDLGQLPQIPTTIAWGTRDVVLIHRTQSVRARELMPFAEHVDLPSCGHLPFSDNPQLCAELVLNH